MTRLIDADWLLNAIEKLKVRNTSNTATIFDVLGVLDDVEKIIKAAPINDPVKHGHWIDTGKADYYLNKEYRCSCCNSVDYLCSPYCYNCGTKMDDEPKEE